MIVYNSNIKLAYNFNYGYLKYSCNIVNRYICSISNTNSIYKLKHKATSILVNNKLNIQETLYNKNINRKFFNSCVKSTTSKNSKSDNTGNSSIVDTEHIINEKVKENNKSLPIVKTLPNSETIILQDNHNRFHNYLRISLTEKCNLRCTYCMPEQGIDLTPKEELMTRQELSVLLKHFITSGVTKIRLTGGEPTINKDCDNIIKEISSYPSIESIGITTNGLTLNHWLEKYYNAGLTHINISLDTLIEAKFNFISKRKGVERVISNIDKALEYGFKRIKINCVLMKDVNDDEIYDFIELTRNRNLDVRFIEFMPFTDNKWNKNKMIEYNDLLKFINKKYKLYKITNDNNPTSNDFQVENFKGKIGFISSMTDKFCSSCNRIRITADGNLKVCLFGREETSLIKLIRENKSDSEILTVISDSIKRKKPAHDGMFEIAKSIGNRPMIKIGG